MLHRIVYMIRHKRGDFPAGATVLISIILIIATLVVYVVFFKHMGGSGTTLNAQITDKLTKLTGG